MRLKSYIKIFFFLVGLFLVQPSLAANYWVKDPANCPTEAYSQSCVGSDNVCGINGSNVVSCYDTNLFSAPTSANSASSGNATSTGGYLLDCYYDDGSVPKCSSGISCWQNTSCDSLAKVTICTANAWATSTCGACKAGYNDCDGNSANGCAGSTEHDGVSCNGGLGTYQNCVCVPISATLKLSYDSAIGSYLKNSTLSVPSLSVHSSGYMMIGSTSTPSTFLSFLNNTSESINMGGGIIRNLSDPVLNQDAATKAYVDSTIPTIINPIIASSSIWQLLGNNTYYNNGKVGIGTNNPQGQLHVTSNITGTSANLIVEHTQTGVGLQTAYIDAKAENQLYFRGFQGATQKFQFGYNSDNGDVVGIGYGTGNNIIINSSGNVGIGVTSPSSTLHISGGKLIVNSTSGSYGQMQLLNPNTGESSIVFGSGITSGLGGTVVSSGGGTYIWGFGNGMYGNLPSKFSVGNVSTGQMMTFDAVTNRIGIGTSSPLAKLDVDGPIRINPTGHTSNYDEGLRINEASNGYATLTFGGSGAVGTSASTWSFHKNPSSTFEMRLNGSNKFTILSSGNVGIGDTNPISNTLSVVGNIAGSAALKISSSTAISWVSGNFGIGNASGGASKLAVFGNQSIGTSYFNDAAPADGLIVQGRVGIGTNNPSASSSLDVNGLIKMRAATSSIINAEDVITKGYFDYKVGSISSIAKFVGVSSASTTGAVSATNGYLAANDLCSNTPGLTGSHVCTSEEMIYTINSGNLSTLPLDVFMWINNGPPGHTSTSNDCIGRTSNANTSFSAVWVRKSTNSYGVLNDCEKRNYFACCK